MKKKALVLAGGGSRGSYQIGVWRALRELGWQFDIVTGSSVGALNGALMAQDDFDAAVQMWETISTSDVLAVDLEEKPGSFLEAGERLALFLSDMAKNGGADPRPLEEMLRRCVSEERVRRSPIDFAFVTVEFPKLTPRIVTRESLPEGELVDYLMASAACFPAMKMREIGGERFIDGGYYDNMPINLAVQRGAREIVAVDLEAVGRVRRAKSRDMGVRYIRSRWDLGVFLRFDGETAKRNMRLGYLDALKAFDRLDGTAYAFERGQQGVFARMLARYFDLITVRTGLSVQKYDAPDSDGGARLARVVKRSGARPVMVTDAAILAAAQTAGRVFGLSPLTVYTAESFHGELERQARQIHEEELSTLGAAFDASTRPRDRLEALSQIDRRCLAAFCLLQLRDDYDGGQVHSARLLLLVKLVRDELTAALYLLALELSLKNSAGPALSEPPF